jgi:ribosomal protein S18 acetylase RimI-like enzyme
MCARDRAAVVAMLSDLTAVEAALQPTRQPGLAAHEAYLRELEHRIEQGGGAILVTEVAATGQLIGAAAITYQFDDPYIDPAVRHYGSITDLYVVPDHRRSGVATHLLMALRDHAASAGIKRLTIDAVSGNAAALALYRRLGFQSYAVRLACPTSEVGA